jgi:arginine exporter protein ArgO
MTSNAELRLQKLLLAYSQERDDERAYWTDTAFLILTIVGSLTALGALASNIPWFAWVAVPVGATMLLVFHVQQWQLGAMRRARMDALEIELSEGEPGLLLKIGSESVTVRLFPFNRITLVLASGNRSDSPMRTARVMFRITSLVPVVALIAFDVLAVWELSQGEHRRWAFIAGALAIACGVTVVTFWRGVHRQEWWLEFLSDLSPQGKNDRPENGPQSGAL